MANLTLADFFNAEEMEGAKKYLEVFHGKILVSDALSRKDAVLLGTYMVSNYNKSPDASKDEAKTFAGTLGVTTEDFSKGLNESKTAGFLTEESSKLSLTFKGLKKIRGMLVLQQTELEVPQITVNESETQPGEGVPSIGTPKSVRDAVSKLLSGTWGQGPKTFTEIMDALELNAVYYPKGTVSTELARMTKQGIIRRLRRGGQFAYVYVRKPDQEKND